MAQSFPNMKIVDIKIQNIQDSNEDEPKATHIELYQNKIIKSERQKQNLKNNKRKRLITYKGALVGLSVGF